MIWIRRLVQTALLYVPGARWLKQRLIDPFRMSQLRFPVTRPSARGTVPEKTKEELRRAYEESGLHEVEDTFVLYRIIGNDLTPRHRKGQSRSNLEFILKHEPSFAGCEKRFVVNRIVEPDEEQRILDLLKDAGMPYLHIPFRWDEYAQQGWDFDGLPAPGYTFSEEFEHLQKDIRERAVKRLYRYKNNYVVNNNGARNAALEDGRGRAKWVLPWDGNCFVTADAWQAIVAAVRAEPWKKYFLVPMARITDNERLLEADYTPAAREEPQILFRRDAVERFDESFFYGRRPKVEMFWRLGVPGKWDEWAMEPWDLPCPQFSSEAGQYGYAGWVARLFSGQPQLETGLHSENQRRQARVEAVTGMLDSLDAKVLRQRGDESRLTFYDESTLDSCREKRREAGAPPASLLSPLRVAADQAVEKNMITEPAAAPASITLLDDVVALALAAEIFNESGYAATAATLVHRIFVAEPTRIPAAVPTRRSWRGKRPDLEEFMSMRRIVIVPDAVRLLQKTGELPEDTVSGTREWFANYLEQLRNTPAGNALRRRAGHAGAWYDVHSAAASAWLGEYRDLSLALRDSRERMLMQFNGENASLFANGDVDLSAWVHLAQLAERWGQDLWRYPGDEESCLRRLVLECASRNSPENASRLFLLSKFGITQADATGSVRIASGTLPPFWQLALTPSSTGNGITR